MLHTAAAVLAATEPPIESVSSGIPPIVLGLLAFGGLVAMLVVTYAFRHVSNRH